METVAGMYSLMKETRVVLLFWTTAPQDQPLTSGDHLPDGPPACSPREAAGPNSKLRVEEVVEKKIQFPPIQEAGNYICMIICMILCVYIYMYVNHLTYIKPQHVWLPLIQP